MYLVDPDLIFSSLLWIIHGDSSGIPLFVSLHHGVLLNMERFVEQYVAIYLLDDVVFHKDQTIYLP